MKIKLNIGAKILYTNSNSFEWIETKSNNKSNNDYFPPLTIPNHFDKEGTWEYVQYDGNPNIGNYHCSVCRYIPVNINPIKQRFKFCPKCGAKMKRE